MEQEKKTKTNGLSDPERIKDLKDVYEETKGETGKEGSKTKRGRGRPKAEKKFKVDEKLFHGIIEFPFRYIATRTDDDKWLLTPEESKELTRLTVAVANKHLPLILDRWGEELALTVFLSVIIMKRRFS